MGTELTTSKDIREFFYKKIKEALFKQQASVSIDVEFYLVNMLNHFSKSENLFQTNEQGRVEYRALALKLYDAVFAKREEKYLHLKSLGDTALYHAGVFYEGLAQGPVDLEYYIDMGGAAYYSLANLSTQTRNPLSDTFHELSVNFAELVEIISLSCEKETTRTDQDLLRLMYYYQQTGSRRAREILEKEGIIFDNLIETQQ